MPSGVVVCCAALEGGVKTERACLLDFPSQSDVLQQLAVAERGPLESPNDQRIAVQCIWR